MRAQGTGIVNQAAITLGARTTNEAGGRGRALGVPWERASRKAPLVDEVARTDARRVLADLAGLADALASIATVRAQHRNVEVIGFCSHTHALLMARAHAAGRTRVMSQGEHTASLPALLTLS